MLQAQNLVTAFQFTWDNATFKRHFSSDIEIAAHRALSKLSCLLRSIYLGY